MLSGGGLGHVFVRASNDEGRLVEPWGGEADSEAVYLARGSVLPIHPLNKIDRTNQRNQMNQIPATYREMVYGADSWLSLLERTNH